MTPMTKLQAIDNLRQWRRYKIANVFENIHHYMNTAMPDWEWPDWDWRTVGEFIRQAEKEMEYE